MKKIENKFGTDSYQSPEVWTVNVQSEGLLCNSATTFNEDYDYNLINW